MVEPSDTGNAPSEAAASALTLTALLGSKCHVSDEQPYFGLDPVLLDRLLTGDVLTLTLLDQSLSHPAWDVLARALRISKVVSLNLSGTKIDAYAAK
jgi:hypothetical protein